MVNTPTKEMKPTPAPSVALQNMVPAAANAWGPDSSQIPFLPWTGDPIPNIAVPHHVYLDHLSVSHTPYDADPDFSKIITPYSAENLEVFLHNANLLDAYPELVFQIKHGFPLGHLQPILSTYAPPNLPSGLEHKHIIKDYIESELSLGQFTGPFTQEELEQKIGPFCSSPLQVAIKEGAPGQPTKQCVCHNLSYKGTPGRSINDEIDSKDFSTHWGTAAQVASFVCTSPPSLSMLLLPTSTHYTTS
jgi:hypothetical protein